MKKILGISLVAVLAAMPLMASAIPVAGDPGATNADAPSATNAPKYSLVDANATDDGKVATAGYVKGAYNAAIKAVNKVSETAGSALQTAGNGLTKSGTTVSADLTDKGGLEFAGSTDGSKTISVKVDGTTIEKNSESGALQVKSGVYATAAQGATADATAATVATYGDIVTHDASEFATAAQGATADTTAATVATYGDIVTHDADEFATAAQGALAATALQSGDNISVLTNDAHYATESGVVATVNAASASYTPEGSVSGTIPVMNNWDAQTGGNLSGATFGFTGTAATINPQVGSYSSGS